MQRLADSLSKYWGAWCDGWWNIQRAADTDGSAMPSELERRLRDIGRIASNRGGDGDCQFRAIAHQLELANIVSISPIDLRHEAVNWMHSQLNVTNPNTAVSVIQESLQVTTPAPPHPTRLRRRLPECEGH